MTCAYTHVRDTWTYRCTFHERMRRLVYLANAIPELFICLLPGSANRECLYIRANTPREPSARVGPELFKAYLVMLLGRAIGSLFSLCYVCLTVLHVCLRHFARVSLSLPPSLPTSLLLSLSLSFSLSFFFSLSHSLVSSPFLCVSATIPLSLSIYFSCSLFAGLSRQGHHATSCKKKTKSSKKIAKKRARLA